MMSRAVTVPACVAALKALNPVDYDDAFAVQTPVRRTPEEGSRIGLEGAPQTVRGFLLGVFKTLRFRLAPPGSADHVLGWEIQHNGPEEIVLGVESATGVTARLVFLTPPGHLVVATLIRFDRVSGRVVWMVLAPIHRVVARYLLSHAANLAAAAE